MNDQSPSAEATPAISSLPPDATAEPRRGRPSSFAPVKLDAVCTFIRLTGLPATTAAALAGIPRATLSRWKDEYEEVEIALERARAQYIVPRLDKIAQTRLKDGQIDWRAQAWLIKYASPELHGPPSRRRRLQDVELSPEEERQSTSAPVAPENVTTRSENLEPGDPGRPPLEEERENVTQRSEIPEPAQEIRDEAQDDHVAIRPETPETTVAATPPAGPQEWRPGVPRPTRRELRHQRRAERKAARSRAGGSQGAS